MALTVYTAGEVLTAASLNANLTFAAANPPASIAGLELISTTTIGTTVSSVTVSGAFSATFDNYRITINGGVASADTNLILKLGAATANYCASFVFMAYNSNTVNGQSLNNAGSFDPVGLGGTTNLDARVDVFSPHLAKNTVVHFQTARAAAGGRSIAGQGALIDTTQHTSFVITLDAGITITGGTIRVYGYKN